MKTRDHPFVRCPVCGCRVYCSQAKYLDEALRQHMLNHEKKEDDNVGK
jgi:hypothetical protein